MDLRLATLALLGCAHTAAHSSSLTAPPVVTQLASFTLDTGFNPRASLVLGPGGALYGTTFLCGAAGGGTVYRFEVPA